MKHLVMGVAGHVDHGKTALIQALTGTDTDRLAEEKKRGLSIDLGFARMAFDETVLEIVDLPGHAGFLKNMLAGASDADLALLVIAADEGVMPQTLEHLRILSLYHVRRFIVALTKCDLADAEMRGLARMDLESLFHMVCGLPMGTPVIEVSSVTGEGMAELRDAVVRQCAWTPVRQAQRPFYMHIDRAFTVTGSGTVVTGTVREGCVSPGDTIRLCPGGRTARVREVQGGGKPLAYTCAGQRAALCLPGIPKEEAGRGMALSADLPQEDWGAPFDAHFFVLPESGRRLASGMRVHIHAGTASSVCRVRLLKQEPLLPGCEGYGQLFPESPFPALTGERFVLRFYSPQETMGGGTVLKRGVPPFRRRFALHAADRMLSYSDSALEWRLYWEADAGTCTEAELRHLFRRWGAEEFVHACRKLEELGLLSRAGDLLLSRARAGFLKGELVEGLSRYHEAHPLQTGMPLAQARKLCPAPLLEQCFWDGTARMEAGCVALPCFSPLHTRRFQELSEPLRAVFQGAGHRLLTWEGALGCIPEADKTDGMHVLELLVQEGELAVLEREFLMWTKAYITARETVALAIRKGGLLSLAQARDLLGCPRRHAQALLEAMDREGITIPSAEGRLLR